MKVTVCNIDWAIDDEDKTTLPNLPTKAVVDGVTSSYDIADALSDKYGFLVNSFEYVDILQDLQNAVTNLEGGRHWGRVSDDIIRKYEEFEDEDYLPEDDSDYSDQDYIDSDLLLAEEEGSIEEGYWYSNSLSELDAIQRGTLVIDDDDIESLITGYETDEALLSLRYGFKG